MTRARMLRVGRRVALALACVELAYVLVANALLGTRLLRHFTNYAPDTTLIEYRRAWSLIPGFVQARGLRVRGRDANVEWQLIIDDASFRVDLLGLARKHFHASDVRVHDVSLRLRLRLDPKETTAAHAAALPDVPGFANPPTRDANAPPPPPSDAPYDNWTIRLEGIQIAHLREVWIHTIRYLGDARVSGRWSFEPGRSLAIGPFSADIAGLSASYGHAVFATDVHGAFTGEIAEHDLRASPDGAMISFLSTSADLEGEVETSLGLSNLVDVEGLQIVDGRGHAHVVAKIDHGVLMNGTHLDMDQHGALVGYGLVTVRDDLRVTFDVTRGADGRDAGRAVAVGSQVRVSRRHAALAMDAASVAVESRRLDLFRAPFSDAQVAFDGHGLRGDDLADWTDHDEVHTEGVVIATTHATWDVPAARAHVDATASTARVYGGSAAGGAGGVRFDGRGVTLTVSADVLESEARVSGALDVAADSVRVEKGGLAVAAKLRAHAAVPELHWDEPAIDLSGSAVSLEHAVLLHVTKAAKAQPAKAGDVVLLSAPAIYATATKLRVAPGGETGRVALLIPRADSADASVVGALVPLPAGVSMQRGSATCALDAAMDMASRTLDGALSMRANALVMGFGARTLTLGSALSLVARRAGGATDLRGSNLSFREQTPRDDADAYWARATADRATLTLAGAPRLFARISGDARDATPAQALLVRKTPIPTWLATAIAVSDLHFGADVSSEPDVLAIENAFVQGDIAQLHAGYRDAHGVVSSHAVLVVEGVTIELVDPAPSPKPSASGPEARDTEVRPKAP